MELGNKKENLATHELSKTLRVRQNGLGWCVEGIDDGT